MQCMMSWSICASPSSRDAKAAIVDPPTVVHRSTLNWYLLFVCLFFRDEKSPDRWRSGEKRGGFGETKNRRGGWSAEPKNTHSSGSSFAYLFLLTSPTLCPSTLLSVWSHVSVSKSIRALTR